MHSGSDDSGRGRQTGNYPNGYSIPQSTPNSDFWGERDYPKDGREDTQAISPVRAPPKPRDWMPSLSGTRTQEDAYPNGHGFAKTILSGPTSHAFQEVGFFLFDGHELQANG